MPFRFSLGALLRVRESQEKAELQRLHVCVAQMMQVREGIRLLDEETDAERRQLMEQVSAGVSGAELHMAVASEAVRRETRATMVVKLEELEAARKKQLLRYTAMRQQREILSNLRKRHWSAYQLEESRRAQQEIDELFLLRRGVAETNSIGKREGPKDENEWR